MLKRMVILFPDIAVAALLLFPVSLYLNRTYVRNAPKSVLYYILAVYFCTIYSVAGLPDLCYVRLFINVNLHPFAYMFSDLDTTLLNILLFIPLGFMLPILWTSFRSLAATVGLGFVTSFMIEFLQIFTYRATDINDLITNTTGTFLGWICAKFVAHHLPENICETSVQNFRIVSASSIGIMFFVHPLFSKIIGF